MADPPGRSPPTNFPGILGISKAAPIAEIAKAYKNLVTKWHPHHKAEADARFPTINEAYRDLSSKKKDEADGSNHNNDKKSPENSYHHRPDEEELIISSPTLLSSTNNRLTPTGTPRTLSFSDGSTFRGTTITSNPPIPRESHGHSRSSSGLDSPPTPTSSSDEPPTSRITSKRAPTPIIFSRTTARRKAQPIEKKLECTLEELCRGCVKKVKITRDVISNEGLMVQEEEILKIKIKPGWKKGTKITFEGKGDEKPGMHPADIIFIIDEKRHPVYKREGDDLELGVEIPLVKALTGCTIPVPLLGGDTMTISVDDIIFPGYEKRIPGQGMPISKEDGKRGDLLLKFLVEFPTELSEEQRSDMVNILQDCS